MSTVYPPTTQALDVWSYSVRKLTKLNFIQIGKAFVPVVYHYDSGRLSISASTTISIPSNEVWLVYFTSMNNTNITISDGTNTSGGITGANETATMYLPLKGGWSIVLSPATSGATARVKALKLDPNAVSVLGGLFNLSANSHDTVLIDPPTDAYSVLMFGLTIGDGTNASAIRKYNEYGYTDLASGTGTVRWTGTDDAFSRAGIYNEADSATVHVLIGLAIYWW